MICSYIELAKSNLVDLQNQVRSLNPQANQESFWHNNTQVPVTKNERTRFRLV